MEHVTAAFAKDNLEDVWEMAKEGSVEVRDGDVVVVVVVSPDCLMLAKVS